LTKEEEDVPGRLQLDPLSPEPEIQLSLPVGKDGPFLSFSGDAEEDEPLASGEDVAVDLFAEANAAVEADENEQEGAEEEEEEPEDDFNAAWEVLDLARALYEKQQDEDDEIKLKLADTFIALGDVSLETGMYRLSYFSECFFYH
jgi:HAT1-interacting factor 1